MSLCKFCGQELGGPGKKCRACGEPQGWRLYTWGMLLKYVPLGSTFVAVLSLCFACLENRSAWHANARAETAQSETRSATLQLQTTRKGADRAIADLTRQLPESSRKSILNNLGLPPQTSPEQLEWQAQREPANADLQRKAFLYRGLKEPN